MQANKFDYNALFARLKENEEIARKFFEVETSVLSTLNFEDFFEKLLTTIKDKFGVPFVWLSIVQPSKASMLVHRFAPAEVVNYVPKETFLDIVGEQARPVLFNRDLDKLRCLMPEGRFYDFRSIAIAPITLDGEIVGSFNQADQSPRRFTPGIDTSLLEQLGVVVSISLSNVAAHEELRALAFKDPLTGILNRRAMERTLRREMSRSERYDMNLSVVFVDLDDFKQVNDHYGHDRGDDLLVYVASNLMEMSRDSDIIARFAGDEFVMILPGVDGDEAAAFMNRVYQFFEEHPMEIKGDSIPVRFSYGVSSLREIAADVNDPAEFLKLADTALYQAKKNKKPSR